MALERTGRRVWQHQDVVLAVGLAALAVVEISAATRSRPGSGSRACRSPWPAHWR